MEVTHHPAEPLVSSPSKATKTSVIQAIKTGDLPQLQKLYELYKFDLNEDYSPNNTHWNCLHYACSFGSTVVLDYLLKLEYHLHEENYVNIVNAKTAEAWTPLMLTVIYDKPDAFNLIVKYGGIRLYEADAKGLKASDLALKYKRENLFKMITKLTKLYPFKEGAFNEISVDSNSLSQFSLEKVTSDHESDNIEDKDEYRELLLNGRRLPCQVCMGDKGWLKYTVCCGEPVHSICVAKITKCPFCGEGKFALTTKLKYPEKAFTLN